MPDQVRRDDVVAIEHETSDRLANVVVTVVPLALLGVAIWLAWGGTLHWQDLVVLAISYIAHRRRHHGRLPPPVHAPQLQDAAGRCGRCSPSWAPPRSRDR